MEPGVPNPENGATVRKRRHKLKVGTILSYLLYVRAMCVPFDSPAPPTAQYLGLRRLLRVDGPGTRVRQEIGPPGDGRDLRRGRIRKVDMDYRPVLHAQKVREEDFLRRPREGRAFKAGI